MIVWTPSQWKQELNSFAARVRAKDYERIPYTNWQIVVGFTKLEPSKKIVLTIDSTTGKMTLTASNSQFSMDSYGMLSLKDYLEDTYYELPIQAASSLSFNVNDLMACRKVELSNSNYATATTNTVLNTNYGTTAFWTNISADNIVNGTYSPNDTIQSEVDNLKTQIENIKTNISENKKEKEDMNFFKNFEFGPVKNDTVRLSPYGLAVKNLDGSWVAYDGTSDSIIDVDVFNFEGKNLIYKIPAAPHTIHTGDMIVHQGKAMCVVADVSEGDTCVSVIDPRAGESKEILFCKNMFGFNYVTKLVSILNGFGNSTDFSPSSDDPFGNMWMLALLSNENEDLSSSILPLMLMNQFNPSANTDKNNFNMNNPLMWILLSNKK